MIEKQHGPVPVLHPDHVQLFKLPHPQRPRAVLEEAQVDFEDREVPGMAIGERVMEGLRKIDPVAYVRFASVYRRFEEATEFVREVKNLEEKHETT